MSVGLISDIGQSGSMLTSKDELRRISISTWPRVIGAGVMCVAAMLVTLPLARMPGSLHLFTTVPVMLLSFAYSAGSTVITVSYKLTAGGSHWNPLTDSPDILRRLIVREEIR